MKKRFFLMLFGVVAIALSGADLTVGGRRYYDYRIVGCNPSGIVIEHATGVATVALEDWPASAKEELATWRPLVESQQADAVAREEKRVETQTSRAVAVRLTESLLNQNPDRVQRAEAENKAAEAVAAAQKEARAAREAEAKAKKEQELKMQQLPYTPKVRNYYYYYTPLDPWTPPRPPRPPRPVPRKTL